MKLHFTIEDLNNYYSLIRVMILGIPCPIVCGENTSVKSYSLPTQPIDKNYFIGDTVYQEPTTITMQAFIEPKNLILFEAQIKLSIKTGFGFTIFTMGGVFSNMFVESFEKPETADINNGFLCNITFQEVKDTSFIGTIIAGASAVGAAAVSTAINGTVNPTAITKEATQSLLGGIL